MTIMDSLDVFFTLGSKLMEPSHLGHGWPSNKAKAIWRYIPHKASKNFLLELAHSTSAHVIGQNSQLAKIDIKKGGVVSSFYRKESVGRSGNILNNLLQPSNYSGSSNYSTIEKAQLNNLRFVSLVISF